MVGVLKEAFLWVFYSSVAASITAFVVILIKAIFKARISSRVYCILWLLVVVKLVVLPLAPESHISVFNLLKYKEISLQKKDTTLDVLPLVGFADEQRQLFWDSIKNNKQYLNYNAAEKESQSYLEEAAYKNGSNKAFRLDITLVVSIIWLTGFLATVGIISYSYILFQRKTKDAQKVSVSQLCAFTQGKKHRLGIKKDIQFYSSTGITGPCIAGILKPRIFLPQKLLAAADKQQLVHILMHEYAHFKRKDNLQNAVVAVVNSIHWFNPVLWYAFRQLALDREISCDALVLEVLGQEESNSYGMTLINCGRLKPQKIPKFSLLGYYKTKKQIERRIIMIKRFQKGSYKLSSTAVILCLMVSATTLTNAADIKPDINTLAVQNITGNESKQPDGQNTDRTANEDIIRAKLGNREYMYFHSLDKALNYAGFEFKLPDYLPDGLKLNVIYLHKNEVNQNNLLEIDVWSSTESGANEDHHYKLSVSKGDLLQRAKSGKNFRFYGKNFGFEKEEKLQFPGLNAVSLTTHKEYELKEPLNSQSLSLITVGTVKNTVKTLIWQNDGVWYSLEYQYSDFRNGKSEISDDLSMDKLRKIVSSFEYPKDLRNTEYAAKLYEKIGRSFSIYDGEDLKSAEALLGFTPKFPISIADSFEIFSANVANSTYFTNDKETFILHTVYRSTAKDKASQTISFGQGTLSSLYDSIVKNGYMSYMGTWNPNTQQEEKLMKSTVSLAGIDAFAFDDGKDMSYIWKQNGVYYTASFSNDIDNKEAIVKAFIDGTFIQG